MKNDLSVEIIKAIDEAIRQFGEYNYGDKGPDEVMDSEDFIHKLKIMDRQQMVDVFCDVSSHKFGSIWLSYQFEEVIEDISDEDYSWIRDEITTRGIDCSSVFAMNNENPIKVQTQTIGEILKTAEDKIKQ